ncbi:MAG: hypothetical protein DI529_10755 [Chryseobacterium sp.]|nr:MAG: hypothetical protein DI529_10755 [Chryseobacterium sp.]
MVQEKVTFESRKDYISILGDLFLVIKKTIQPLNKKINPWFLIRVQTGYFFHLIYSGKIKFEQDENISFDSKGKNNVSLKSRAKSFLSLFILFFKLKKYQKKLTGKLSGRTLYLGYHSHNIKDGSYNIYLHPFYNDDKEKGEIFYIDFTGNNQEIQYYYQLLLQYYNLKDHLSNRELAYSNAKKVYESLKISKDIKSNLLNNKNYSTMESYPAKIEAYKVFLKILDPKQLFFYCYYDSSINAMSYAAGELGIPTIEYQHSNITDTHFAYAKWENPEEIKAHFPKTFYVWEDSDKDLILRNFSGDNYVPEVKVVGNKYLQKTITENRLQKSDSSKNILVCLQGQWIPKFLEEFMYNDKEYTWYFRLHPRYPQDNEILKQFASKKLQNVVVDKANNLELYDLFAEISILMTSFSGTALEAEKFGKKVIIFGEEGYLSYQEKIDTNVFEYIDCTETLQKIL